MSLFHSHSYRIAACALSAMLVLGCSKEAKISQLEATSKAYLDAGEPEKAKIAYLNLLQQAPGNATAIGQLGRIWTEQGAPLRALPYLMKSRELSPKNAELRYKLSVVLMTLGQAADARKEAAAALQAAPGYGEALIMLAETCRTPDDKDATRRLIDSFPVPGSADRHLAEVPLLLGERDVLGAEAAVERALAAEPNSVRALVAAGSLRIARNDLEGAEKKFKEAADLAPVRSPQKLQLAEFVARRGRLDEARAMVSEICKKAPDYIPAWMLAARFASEAKQYDEALTHLDRILGIDSDNYPARLQQADCWVAKQDFPKAIEVLQKLEVNHPRQPQVKYQLGRALLQNGEPEKAATALRAATALNPDFPEAVFMLAQIDLRSGRPEEVVPAMRQLLEKRPGLVKAAIALVDAYQLLGRLGEATELMNKVAESSPENIEYRLRVAQLQAQAGQAEAARAEVQKALEKAPGHPAAISALVEMDLVANKVDEAQARVKELLEKTPDSAAGHVIQGRIHAFQKAWPEAEKDLQKAIELNGEEPGALELLIEVQRSAGKFPEAIQQAEAVLARRPDDAGVLRQVGILYVEQGVYDKAAKAYEKLLSILTLPDPMILNNLAILYSSHLNQPDRGYELARQARELRASVAGALNPNEKIEAASIADTLGWVLYHRGEFSQAFSLTQEAAGLLGGNAEVQYHLGLAAAAMGENEAARKALALAVSGTPEFPGQADARQHLSLLENQDGKGLSTAEIAALVGKTPTDVVLQLRLAEAKERDKNLPEAAAAYAAALTRNPALTVAAYKLAELYAGPLNDPAKALENARKARQLAPNDSRVASLLGALAFRSGDHAFAYDLLREATRNGVKDAATFVNLANAAYSIGTVEEARTAMKDALAAAPEPPLAEEATRFLALTAPVPPGGALAAAAADAALQKNPRDVPALMVRAAVRTAENDAKAAQAAYDEVLAVYPSFIPAQLRLAVLLAEDAGSYERGYELATKVRKALPNDPEVAELLGRLCYHRKDYPYALQLFAESARLRPLDARGLYYQGMCQRETGDLETSKSSLEQALKAGLADPLAATARTAIEALSKP